MQTGWIQLTEELKELRIIKKYYRRMKLPTKLKAKVHLDDNFGFGLLISTGGIGIMVLNVIFELDWK
jgi:hypothetical protein